LESQKLQLKIAHFYLHNKNLHIFIIIFAIELKNNLTYVLTALCLKELETQDTLISALYKTAPWRFPLYYVIESRDLLYMQIQNTQSMRFIFWL